MGIEPCWTVKELDKIKRMEQELRENQVELDYDSKRALYENLEDLYLE
jgi:flagellin-specific chaperone FliS